MTALTTDHPDGRGVRFRLRVEVRGAYATGVTFTGHTFSSAVWVTGSQLEPVRILTGTVLSEAK